MSNKKAANLLKIYCSDSYLFKFKVVLTDCNSNLMFIFCNDVVWKILIELAGS